MSTMAAVPARSKGPLVWLDMDQQELDDAYDQIVYAPNRDQVAKRRLANSAAARARIGEPSRFAYGPTPIEGLDVYRCGNAECSGRDLRSWRRLAQRHRGGIHRPGRAVRACRRRISSCSTSSMSTMPAAACFRWSSRCAARSAGYYRNAEKFGGDRNRLHLISHSSGSHLAGCVVTHDWAKDGLPRDILKGAALSSGMYDLEAGAAVEALEIREIHRCDGGRTLRHSPSRPAQHAARSQLRHLRDAGIPAPDARLCRRGESDAGKPVELLVGEGYNHFEMLETLANPYGLLGRAVLGQMGLLT